MVFVCIFLYLMLGVSAALPQDMSGKMFTFPQATSTAHIRITTSRQNLEAVTVCLRSFTDLTRGHSIFSLATPSADNGFLIYKDGAIDKISAWVMNEVGFEGQDYKLNKWQSVCSTWDSTSGLLQLWINGKPSSRKFAHSSNISGPFIIVLGQEQDSHGGGFDINQSFVGMMTDVYMWDYVLTPCQIQSYSQHLGAPPGNILNWNSIEFQTIGRVLIEDNQELC